MRFLVVVRGDETPLRQRFVSALLGHLNPNPNSVRAIRIAMRDYYTTSEPDKTEKRAADRSCKNLLKKVLQNHSEEFIVLDNLSINTENWESYLNLAIKTAPEIEMIGIDVIDVDHPNDAIWDAQLKDAKKFQEKSRLYMVVESDNFAPVFDTLNFTTL